MWLRLRAFIKAPRFEDERKNVPAFLLNSVLLIAMLGIGLIVIAGIIVGGNFFILVGGGAALVAVLMTCFVALRRGYVVAPGLVLIVLLWVGVTSLEFLFGGLNSTTLVMFLPLIIIAALLIGPNGGMAMSVAVMLTLGILYLAQSTNRLPEPLIEIDQLGTLIIVGTNGIMVALLMYVATISSSMYLTRAHSNEDTLRRTIADLKATTVNRNYVDNILQSMSNLLIVLNNDGTIRTANRAALDRLGYREVELIGRPFNLLLSDDEDSLEHAETLSATQLLRRSMVRDIDQIFLTRDGQELTVMLSSSALYDQNDDIQGVVCVAQDVTDRRSVEAQVTHQASLLESVSDAIISTSMDLTIETWNKAAEEVYGYKASEVVGKNMMAVIPTSFPDGEQEDIIKKQYMERGHWQSEVIQRRKDGSPLHVLSSIALMRDGSGRPSGTVTINHNITDRKLAEQELKNRAEQLTLLRQVDIELSSSLDVEEVLRISLNAAIYVSGADAGFILLSDREYNWRQVISSGRYGEQPPGPVIVSGVVQRAIQRELSQLVVDVTTDPDYVATLPETVAQIAIPLRSQARLFGILNLETSQDGVFSESAFDLMVLLGSRIAVAIDNARLYELSNRHLVEMQELYTQVSKLEELKTDMIRIASHDLRNPVGIINGYIQLMRLELEDKLSVEDLDHVEQIERQVRRMDDIATNLLSLERIHQVAREEFTETVDIWTLTQQAVLNHTREALHKGLSMHFETSVRSDPLLVHGDSNQLMEAVVNFLTNAIKYTPEGGSVTVRLMDSGEHAFIDVIDTGFGIPEEQQERLFQPFYRVESEATTDIEGVGLGLHLVKNIIQRHGGEVEFKSTYGQGSTFSITLPLAETSVVT